jgi:hypothetical protein
VKARLVTGDKTIVPAGAKHRGLQVKPRAKLTIIVASEGTSSRRLAYELYELLITSQVNFGLRIKERRAGCSVFRRVRPVHAGLLKHQGGVEELEGTKPSTRSTRTEKTDGRHRFQKWLDAERTR